MLKSILILISHLLLISSNPIVEPSSLTPASTTNFDNIAFIKLGSYRGFKNDGAEYQKTYFMPRFSQTNWAESRSFCNSYKMDLLTIETEMELKAYLNLLNINSYLRTIPYIQFWADSLTVTLKSKTEWFWTGTGNKISFPISWIGTEPNNDGGSEHCLVIFKPSVNANFGFADGNCNIHRYALCQKLDLLIPNLL
ncbi:hypothetical protein ACKWTF_008872 [Chironomus riparius]